MTKESVTVDGTQANDSSGIFGSRSVGAGQQRSDLDPECTQMCLYSSERLSAVRADCPCPLIVDRHECNGSRPAKSRGDFAASDTYTVPNGELPTLQLSRREFRRLVDPPRLSPLGATTAVESGAHNSSLQREVPL